MTNLYDTYKGLRKTRPGIPALHALRMARSRIVEEVTKAMRGDDHPLNMPMPLTEQAQVFEVQGRRFSLIVEYDNDIWYDDADLDGFKVKRNPYEFYESGWGQQGMDEGEYVADRSTLVVFNETRSMLIDEAPSYMSRQQKYEWATNMMRSKLERFQEYQSDERYRILIRVEGEEDFFECIGGIEVTIQSEEDEVRAVFSDIYSQIVYEVERYKDVV